MQIRVLGPVDVVDDAGGNVALRGPMPARLLALLVAAGGSPVAVDDLVIELWTSLERPVDPVAAIRTYVARLRSSLGAGAVLTGTGAYSLGPVDTDAVRFEDLLERARRSSGSPHVADIWRQALDLWRGPAFGDYPDSDLIRPEANRLDELRAAATEAWFDARLAAGEGRELAADVDRAVAEFPLREGFRVQQMTVLSRAGRPADALRAFQEFRSDLTEIGLEPSARLAELDQLIASGETPRSGARRTLRGYELGDRIGEGAFAVVHQATQASVGREVAIKQIRSSLADQPAFIAQFEAEAHLVARLEHPHIVPLYDYWREPGSAYLVMRYLDGGSLSHRLLDGPMSLPDVVAVVGQVAAALDAAHRAGVIHRDVKPANILLDQAGNAYLSDFGIAVEEAARLDPEAWLSHGSPAYAPPEQLERRPVGPEADVYALGVAVFESLAGNLPFPAETTMADLLQRQLNDPIPLIRLARPELPAAVDAVVQMATAKQPEQRYSRASEFAAELSAAAGLEGDAVLITSQDRNPYKGLRAFDAADAADFSGRDRLTARLLVATSAARAVLVVGPSGSGKSSVVRAGLMPALRLGHVRGSGRWFTTTMTPGADPFVALTSALLRVAVDPPADLLAELVTDADALRRVMRRIVPDGQSLVLVIDQFEELFTVVGESGRRGFLDALVTALADAACGLRLLATLRADFYDHPLRHPAFAALVEDSTISVHPLAADELERAITEPAAAVGASFEPRLVAEISADVADQPGALPLLQYALTELFDARDGNVMTRAAYERLGGVTGALARRAEEVFVGLSSAEQGSTRRLFGRLVSLGEGTEDTRRRVSRAELGADRSVNAVVDAFGSARLLSFDRDPASREATVEVAHEALLREWPRLRDWVDEDRDGLRVLRHLADSARAWDASGRPESELYRGGRLEGAEEWALERRAQLTVVERAFLEAGLETRAAVEAADVERLEAEQRSNRRLRRLLAGVAVALVVALLAGVLAFQQRSQARESAADATSASAEAEENAAAAQASADEADIQRANAETRRMVADAASVVGENRDVALLLAAEAYRRDPVPEILAGLQRVLANTGHYLGPHRAIAAGRFG